MRKVYGFSPRQAAEVAADIMKTSNLNLKIYEKYIVLCISQPYCKIW